MSVDRQILKKYLFAAMDRYAGQEGPDLLSSLACDRIVEQIQPHEASDEAINLCLELHPEYTSGDDPAAVWINTNWNGMSEFGVLLIFKDGRIEKGTEFSSI